MGQTPCFGLPFGVLGAKNTPGVTKYIMFETHGMPLCQNYEHDFQEREAVGLVILAPDSESRLETRIVGECVSQIWNRIISFQK